MKPNANDKKVSHSSQNLPQIIRSILIICLISAVTVPGYLFHFWMAIIRKYWDWIYIWFPGSGTFRRINLAGNTVPAQLSKLSLPSVRRHQKFESDGSPFRDEGKNFFFTTLI